MESVGFSTTPFFVGLTLYFGWPHRWDLLQGNARISVLADVYGVAAGTAVFITISVEALGRMVLLIPAAVKKLKSEGRREQRRRERQALAKFGREVNGVLMLPMTPEVEQFLSGESDESVRPPE